MKWIDFVFRFFVYKIKELQLKLSILALFLAVFSTAIISFFCFRQPGKKYNILFALYFLGYVIWTSGIMINLAIYAGNPATDTFYFGSLPYFFEQFLFFGVIILITAKYWFVKVYPEDVLPKKLKDYWLLPFSVLGLILVVIPNSLFKEIIFMPSGGAILDTGPGTMFYSAMLFTYYLTIPVVIFRKMNSFKKSSLQRKRFSIFFWAHIATFTFMISFNWILPVFFGDYRFNAFGPIFSFISVGAFAYAVTKYRFLDLRINFQRALTYATTIALLGGLLLAVIFKLPSNNTYLILFANAITLLTIAVAFSPLKNVLNRAFNQVIFHDKKNYKERLAELGQLTARSQTSVEDAARFTLAGITQALGLKSCQFLSANGISADGVIAQTKIFDSGSLYVDELESRAELENDQDSVELAKVLRSEDIAVLQPIFSDDRFVGALILSEKENNEVFTANEIEEVERVARDSTLYFAGLNEIKISSGESGEKNKRNLLQEEVNNSLTRVVLAIGALQKDFKKNSPEYSAIKNIEKNIFQATRAQNQFLEIEKFDDHQSQSARASDVFDLAWSEFESELKKREIKIAKNLEKPEINKDILIAGNSFRIASAISELLLNAAAFGGKFLKIEFQEKQKEVIFRISNDGRLTSKEIKKFLILFGKSVDSTGNGIGLNFARSQIESAGGSLKLQSSRGSVAVSITLKKVNLDLKSD